MPDLVFRSASSLAAAIRNREISSLELIDAHLEHIANTNPPLNAIVLTMADRARAEARQADEALAKGNLKGPFHGVPMSVKDAWEVAGVPSTGGTLGRAKYIPEHDATVIARMRAAGAIPLAMTNLPELSFAFESDNLVHGRSSNPYNPACTPGGSGGGGGAAIASGMSPIEIGADLGGSIRLPSHFCGIAGIRGTTGRCPMTGYFPPSFGWVRMLCDAGPMARSVEDLELALPVLAGPDFIDPGAQNVPLRDPRAISIRGLRVAIHTDNGIMPARPDVAATVMAAAKALAAAGAIVEERIPAGISQCFEIFMAIATADGGFRNPRCASYSGNQGAKSIDRRLSRHVDRREDSRVFRRPTHRARPLSQRDARVPSKLRSHPMPRERATGNGARHVARSVPRVQLHHRAQPDRLARRNCTLRSLTGRFAARRPMRRASVA